MSKVAHPNIDRWEKSYCPYCGVGCGLTVGIKDNQVVKVKGDPDHPSSRGDVCAKPIYLPASLRTPDRLLYPQARAHQEAAFERVSWAEALQQAAFKFQQIIDRHGPQAVAFYGSGQFLTEDYYVINKLAKGFLGSNNFDANSRLCMASAVAGYVTGLGSDGPPAAYEDIELADCFFLIGTNTADCHPVIFDRIKQRKRSAPDRVKVIVVDPRETATAKIADLYLPLRPGTDIALLNAMLHVLLKAALLDESFIAQHTQHFEEVKASVESYSPEAAAATCGLPAALIVEAALAFGQAQGTLSFWSMGLNQSTVGVAKNQAILNLHLATGKIGRPGNGPFSLTGQPNAMGGREAGGLSHLLPGYRLVKNPAHRAEVEAYWGVPAGRIAAQPGLTATEMFEAAARGQVKALWIACTNPAVSMPNLDLVETALRRAELVVVQDAYHPTDTGNFAHILLPAAQWSEKAGVMTNSERRITYLPQLVDPPGEALPDWQIFARFAQALGFAKAFAYRSSAEVFAEFVGLTRGQLCDYSGLSHTRLQAKGPTQWPCPTPHHPGTIRLYTDLRFSTPTGRANFNPVEHADPVESPDAAYPLWLNTGRVKGQWHTMTRTGKSESLLKDCPELIIELHPTDAARWDISNGNLVKVASRRGTAIARARVTAKIKEGVCFMPFHWGRLLGYYKAANNLTSDAVDPISKEPELKACAVQVTPVWEFNLPQAILPQTVEQWTMNSNQ
jgi:formate dehydrogenase alpha subunit